MTATGPEPGPVTMPGETGVRSRRVPVVWLALLVLLLGGGGLLVRAEQLRDTPSARNRALTDTGATTRVADELTDAVTRIFSYAPTSLDATRAAAREVLAGKAARQYEELFGQVERRTGEQRLTLTTHVVRVGVRELSDGEARVLLFLDQVAERAGAKPSTTAAQLSLTAARHDGRWRITDIASR
ncbi:hypothetical protein ACFVIM_15110 [Streptomyces sp. NPDC057638]|uniref:hypothetical protein n=1 Tax=Streptomyces sp. NPDC057638 TaxID=3346190 RepID=UPI0036CD4A40